MNKSNNKVLSFIGRLIIIVGILALLATTYAIYQHQGVVTELHSTQGCCSIYVNHQGDEWTIIHQDNRAGTQHIEVETRQVDADYMVNLYQEYCYTHHK